MKKRIDLAGSWTWSTPEKTDLCVAQVPGSLLTDMLQNNLIDDPFWRNNEYATRELLAQDFICERNFTIPREFLLKGKIDLVCEGLDTLSSISINGKEIARTDNMHRTWHIPVEQVLSEGDNSISVLFSSSLRFVRQEDASNDIHYASTGSIRGNAAIRKAHYMFGWDWGPQLPDLGIFRSIYLERSSCAVFEDVLIRQFHDEVSGSVELTVETTVCFEDAPVPAEIYVEITCPQGKTVTTNTTYEKETQLHIPINEPQLWWPNNMGDQPLYLINVRLYCAGNEQDNKSYRIGLRTINVSTTPDEFGSEFAITVNGIKIFACGANYIPQDNLIPRIKNEDYRLLIADCATANFNCIRVWGGGYYPDDAFYDACDEFGILVWQDFMFACNVYALTDSFEHSIQAEIRDVTRRLRHHASLALWCGNNEMEWGWGEEWTRIKGHHPRYKADYLKIFEMIVPRTLRESDDQTYFWSSSPSSGGAYDFPNDPNRGDQHYWDVWHSGKPFTEYRNFYFRFCSEYGFQSFPHIKTIKQFTVPEDRNIFSEVMESHQKNPGANEKILNYIAQYFLYPKDIDSLAYISQILQLKAIQYGVEHWRRNRGRCMGSLYWQLNDCWPVASWASIDYYGRWKALHYGAKRFYAPFTVSVCEKSEQDTFVEYFVHNDSHKCRDCVIEVCLQDTTFNVLYKTSASVTLNPFSVVNAMSLDFTPYIKDSEHRKQVFAVCKLICEEGIINSSTTLFVKPKHFYYPDVHYTVNIDDCGANYELQIQADAFSQYTELYFMGVDAIFEDNYFDITTNEPLLIKINKDRLSSDPGVKAMQNMLVIRAVRNTY